MATYYLGYQINAQYRNPRFCKLRLQFSLSKFLLLRDKSIEATPCTCLFVEYSVEQRMQEEWICLIVNPFFSHTRLDRVFHE